MSDDELIEAMRQAWLDAPFYEGELMLDSDLRAMREEHLKFSGFIPKEITALDAWRACWAQKDAELAALRIENDTLRAELESAHAAQRHAETELSQYMAWYAMAEHQHLHEQRRAEKAEAERDALKAATSRCGLNFLTYNPSKGEPNEM